jgi:hypothetical protein
MARDKAHAEPAVVKAPPAPVVEKPPEPAAPEPERARVARMVMTTAAASSEGSSGAGSGNPTEPGTGLVGRAGLMRSLQRTMGNARVSRMVVADSSITGPVQAKLTVGQPGDAYEQEADQVANRVAGGPGRPHVPGQGPPITQLRSAGLAATPSGQGEIGQSATRVIAGQDSGRPLNALNRGLLESRLGADLSGVRVHDDAAAQEAARALNARAFTHGKDIWLGAGESENDLRLMAHEATHVVQQEGAPGTIRRSNGGGQTGAPAPPAPPPAAPGVGATPAPAGPAPGGVSVTVPGSPPPATQPSSATEIILPSVTLFEAEELSKVIFDLPVIDKTLWQTLIELPPPLFAATVGIRAHVGLRGELFLRYGPAVLRDIRVALDPSSGRYSGTAQLNLPVAAGPRLTLSGSLIGSAEWLGLVEVLALEGGLRAIGQAPLIVAISPSVYVLYDRGSYTFNLRPQLEAGFSLLFDLEAFAKASVLKEKVWEKKWNLFHWQWGRAVRLGVGLSLDYDHGKRGPVRVEPFAERISIDELLEGMREPADKGGVTVITPGKRPLKDRLGELLGPSGGDPQVILAALAEATDAERAAVLGDEAKRDALQKAVGNALWPTAQRILTNAPSETVPSLDEGTVFLAARHIRLARFQDALNVIVSKLQAKGIINGSLVQIAYVRDTASGEGLTRASHAKDPATGMFVPTGPAQVSIYDPAFVNVPWLYSSIMHEYVHVLQFQQAVKPTDYADPEWPVRREVEAYLWEIEHARGSGVIVSPRQMEDLGKRLTDNFNRLGVASQANYRARYGDALKLVRDAASGVLPVHLTYSIEGARRTVQESSRRIAELVRLRAAATNPADQAKYDGQIATIQRERTEALVEVVLAENPNVQIVDRAKGIYRTPVTDGAGLVQWLYGSISVVWHLQQVSPSVFSIGAQIGSRPPVPGVTSRLLVGGSGIQSTVQPFPGDIDFAEEFDIAAPDANAAGAALAATIAEFVSRTATRKDFEFVRLRIMPTSKLPGKNYVWDQARILDPGQRAELGLQLAGTGGGGSTPIGAP